MPDLSVSETQLERLEEISTELEAVYVGEYGTVRPADALQYLLDTYTPPETGDDGVASDEDGTTADADALIAIDGVGEATAESLIEAGFGTIETIRDADPEALTEIKGIGSEQAADIAASAATLELDGTDEVDASGSDDSTSETGAADSTPEDGPEETGPNEDSPEDTLQQAMSLLDAHDDRWRESSGDEPYEVDLPDGSTVGVRTKDDIKRLIFKHWR